MRNAAVAASGANVQVNTHSAARKYKGPTALVPETARSVAAAPNINNGVASGSTISESSTLPRRSPIVSPAPMAPSQLKVMVPKAKLSIMVANAATGIANAIATIGETTTNAAPVTSQCAQVFATTMRVRLCPLRLSCSKVPSSASLLNSESKDSSEDNSAAVQSTPGD